MHLSYTSNLFKTVDGIKIQGCSRPGYPVKSEIEDPLISEWIEEVKQDGFKSIICLLDDNQLAYYSNLEAGGLLESYRKAGLEVHHYPIPDHQFPPVEEKHLKRILKDLKSMLQPVLIHCSAGCDRTGAIIDFIRRFS